MLALYLQSVFSFRAYHRLRTLGKWQTIFFVVYIWLLGLLAFNIWFALQARQKLPVFLQNIPELTFETGTLTAPDKSVSVSIPKIDLNIVFDASAKQIPTRQEFLDKHILAFITKNKIYTPSTTNINSQTIPASFTASITQDWLRQHTPIIRSTLQGTAFLGSALGLIFFLFFSFCLAVSVVYLWSGWRRKLLPFTVVWRWAALLQGPALTLWLVNLFWGIPLFLFGLFILFMMYTQQIFNWFTEEKR